MKALPKPSVSAWAVNQLYWRHRETFDRLMEAGESLRHAQTAHPSDRSAREAVDARRDAVSSLAAIATGILRDGRYGATRDMLRRVSGTLEALSSYGAAPGAPPAGRLVDDVEPPGFDAMADLLRASGGPQRAARAAPAGAQRVTSAARGADRAAVESRRRDQQRLAAGAKTAVRNAERALGAARKQAERAAAKLESAAARAEDADAQRTELASRLARATAEADAARAQARAAEAAANAAAQTADGAERALAQARRALEQLLDREPRGAAH